MSKNVQLSTQLSQSEVIDKEFNQQNSTKWSSILLLFSIIALLMHICGILSAWNTPYTGYEPNIYSATPILFWIGLISCYIVGIIYILVGLQTSYRKLSKLSFGFIFLSLAALAQISLPFLRGYFAFYIAGDAGTHVGRIVQTITQGSIYPANIYYPGIYAESSAFQILTGVDVFATLAYLPILLFAVYLIGVLLLSQRLFPKIHERIFVIVIALLLPSGSDGVLYISFVPYLYQGQMFANTLLPYVLFLILTAISINKRSIVLLVITCIAMFFYHPIPSLSVVVFLASVVVWSIIKRGDTWRNKIQTVFITALLLLSTLVGFILVHWNSFGHTILRYVSTTLSKISEVIIPSTVTPSVPVTPSVSVTTTELLSPNHYGSVFEYLSQMYLIATSYGITIDAAIRSVLIGICIYGLFVVAILIYLCYLKRKTEYRFVSLFSIYGIALILLTLGLYLVNASGYTRLVPHIFMIAVLFSGFVISQIYTKLGDKSSVNSRKRFWTVFCILLIICLLSVISFHPSPFTMNGGDQTTEAEYIGAETILQYVDIDSSSDIMGIHFTSTNRFIAAIYGASPYGDLTQNNLAPRHFGYDSGKTSLVDSIDTNVRHLIITDKDYQYYPIYLPQLIKDRYTETDYLHLTMDTGIGYVYNNGGFGMYDVG